MKKYFIETFGCQMNEFDSERISWLLEKENYLSVQKPEEADVIIINTCAVREKAKNKLYGHIGNLRTLKTSNPDLMICIGGCSAQNLKEKILKDFPYVDIIFGTHNISQLPELILKRKSIKKSICEVKENGFDYVPGNFKNTFPFKAYVPVSHGCNNFCTYCIVPYVRGREISIKPAEIIEDIKRLADNGVVEIMLLGQNVNSYGKDFEKPYSFSELLAEVAKIKEIRRIRFMTSHPKDLSQNLIDVIAQNFNIMNHIHLPLQSGSNKILKLMNRNYTKEKYLEIIDNIKSKISDCSITTDIITGFPGEERNDFEHTLDVVNKVRFNRAFTFIYSKRDGTAACNMEDNISIKEKKEWFKELLVIQNKISLEENMKLVDRNYEVLVEGEGSKGLLEGRLENNCVVNFEGNKNLIGKFVNINIASAKSFYLKGKIIKINDDKKNHL
ncbi:MAG: tRNA (N6-isopentenyl adenosine(37)-C2)-methylthiotransferase MiaB [Actinobacteria bacterium]|nr:tRNA (N6-isopentenyl adenosine(37)-C2)-methylthiotransferase MiaB [Actinomycetota bacterium]